MSKPESATIPVFAQVAYGTGYGMRRGSILLNQKPRSMPVTFNDAGHHDLRFLALLLRELRGLQTRFNEIEPSSCRAQRLVGDRGCDGRREILVLD